MRKIIPLTLSMLLGSMAFASPSGATTADKQDFATIERGRYLTVVGDCAACHTDPGSGADFAGGSPVETPFGPMLAPNITPDRETGIGAWTDDEFVAAVKDGWGREHTHLYPAMPYPYMTRMSTDDVLAIRAYLRTVPPVHNPVDSNQLPFPFNIRMVMAGWNTLFFKAGPFVPRADKDATWNRGAYLVEGPMHCGACHTPKNLLGGDKDAVLTGYTLQGWFAPNLTPDVRTGLGTWSNDDIVAYLKTGQNRMAAASGLMGEEVSLSSSKMTDADLRAIAAYLKDGPEGQSAEPTPVSAADSRMRSGAAIYHDECAACHRDTGEGVEGLFPALRGAPVVQSAEPTSLIHVVLTGVRSVATAPAPTAAAMPPFGWLLTDGQTADVLTYIRNAWGNAAAPVAAGDVGSARARLRDNRAE
jgi:mono/diheme cytochrome c family protein